MVVSESESLYLWDIQSKILNAANGESIEVLY